MRRAALLVVVIILIGSVLVPIGAVAQSNESTESTESDEDSTVVEQVDDDVRVTDYDYDEGNETFSVELDNRGDSTSTVTLTESISSDQSGGGSFGIEQTRLYANEETTVEVDVSSDGRSAGVMITTQESLDAGTGTYLQEDTGMSLLDGSATWRDVQIGVGAGIVATILMTMLVAWHVVARQSVNYEEVDLA